jgi:hypothetical protein
VIKGDLVEVIEVDFVGVIERDLLGVIKGNLVGLKHASTTVAWSEDGPGGVAAWLRKTLHGYDKYHYHKHHNRGSPAISLNKVR